MNRLLITAALTVALGFAQNAKVAPGSDAATPAAPSERALTETEILKFQLTGAKLQLLQDRYRIAEYQKEVDPISAEQQAVATAACKSIGIPEDQIRTSCAIQTGFGQDGKPLLDPAGKPVQAKVWRVAPAAPPVAPGVTK